MSCLAGKFFPKSEEKLKFRISPLLQNLIKVLGGGASLKSE
jgi:hypothetical protein